MKNILILDTGKEWGGGTNSFLELLKRIDRKNYKFTVLFYYNCSKSDESDIKTEIERLGIDFLLLERFNQPFIVKMLKEFGRTLLFFDNRLRKLHIFWLDYFFRIKKDAEHIARILKDLNIDLLYMNNQPSTNLEGIIAVKNVGIKSLLHSRIEAELNFFEINATNKWLTKMICVSEGVRESFVRQGIKSSLCTVVHNGIDISITPAIPPDRIRQEFGIKENEIVIGSVGSLVKRKRFDDLINVVAHLRTQNLPTGQAGTEHRQQTTDNPPIPPLTKGSEGGFLNKIKCLIVGDGPEKEALQKEINKNRLDNIVILTGFKTEAISYINAMDIFVLLSEREGLPRVILEAMLMKKPVVAANIAGPTELVADGKTGYLIQLGKFEDAASAVAKLVISPALRKEMGMNGYHRVIKEFTIDNYIQGVENIFKEIQGQ